VVHRDWLQAVHGFDPEIFSREDYDLLLRLAYAGCKMAWLKQIVCCYRVHGESRHAQLYKTRHHWKVLEKFFARPELPPEIRARQSEVLKREELNVALWFYAAGDAEPGAAHLGNFFAGQEWSPPASRSLAVALGEQVCMPELGTSPLALVDFIWAHLPPEAAPLRPFRKLARASAAKRLFFEAHLRQDRAAIRAMFWQVLKNAPPLLDRGMFVLLVKTHVPTPR
ncbi:MAG: glycosyltransferase family 2 protein, partial [Candidatus Oleimicrobiaceae bacterium]